MSKKQIEQLKKQIDPYVLKVSQPAYTYYQAKLESCTITAYTSGKVVFQGKDLNWLSQESSSESKNMFPQAGSDEVGTGDYFGPVVVSAVIVSKENEDVLRNLKIQDSKQINDEKIRMLAKEIKSLCPHTILIVSSSKYNSVHKQHNMVDIKCKLHNQAYLNLIKKDTLYLNTLSSINLFKKRAIIAIYPMKKKLSETFILRPKPKTNI